MKGLFKLTTAALALFAFASCSTDDLFGNGADQEQNKEGILVEVEPLVDANTTITRSAYTPSTTDSKGTLSFTTNDAIRVTDGTMLKYDIYSFNGSAFVFDKDKTERQSAYVTDPKFSSFPDAFMDWDNAKLQSVGHYMINQVGTWAEQPNGDFKAEIPMWGEAQKDETYGIKTTLKYLTGVVRINLENVPGNATAVRVVGWKNIAGTNPIAMAGAFKAIYATDDEINEDATLEPEETSITVKKYGEGTGNYYNYIEYDLNSAKKAETFIFVPVIAQKYGLLQFEYNDGTEWKKIDEKQNVTVKRATWYAISMDEPFKVAGDTPSAITTVLEQLKDKSEISIETANATKVSDTDKKITIPETSADVTLKLANLEANGSGILYINSVDDAYAGTLTLDVTGTPTITNIMINLPEANVVVKGANLGAVDLGKDAAPNNEAEGMAAKCLVIDGKVQNIYANAELGWGNAGADLKILKGAEVNKIEFETNYKADEIEINGTLASALTMTAWKDLNNKPIQNVKINVGNGADTKALLTTGDITITGGTVTGKVGTDGNVVISGTEAEGVTAGKVVGDVIALNENTNTQNSIVLSGEAQIKGNISPKTKHTWTLEVKDKAKVYGGTANVDALTINGTTASVETAVVAGNATINDTEEAEAIKTKLTMTAGNTLNLNGGYIKNLEVNPATKKALTIQHGTAAAYTAIATKSGEGKIKVSGTSVWNGKKIGDGTENASAKTAIKEAYATGKSDLFTATQLASYTGAVDGKLYANVNLNGKEWNGISLTGGKKFEGADIDEITEKDQFPTIENLYLYGNDEKNPVTGVGLFAKTTGSDANTIQNFTLKNVTSGINGTKGVSEFGALVGNAVTELTINNVTVETATIGTTKVAKVGGLVGNTTKAITLNKVTVKALTLNGESQIGGVVGVSTNETKSVHVADNSTIAVTAINVPTEHQSTPDITKVAANTTKYGAVGMIAGAAAKAVTFESGKTLTVNDLITGHRQKMGYTWYYENPGPGLRYYHGHNGDKNKSVKDWVWVGLRSDIASTTPVTTAAEFDSSYGTTEKALMVKHDIYTSCDK